MSAHKAGAEVAQMQMVLMRGPACNVLCLWCPRARCQPERPAERQQQPAMTPHGLQQARSGRPTPVTTGHAKSIGRWPPASRPHMRRAPPPEVIRDTPGLLNGGGIMTRSVDPRLVLALALHLAACTTVHTVGGGSEPGEFYIGA